jgi:hypothetical protein
MKTCTYNTFHASKYNAYFEQGVLWQAQKVVYQGLGVSILYIKALIIESWVNSQPSLSKHLNVWNFRQESGSIFAM